MGFGRISTHLVWFWRLGILLTSGLAPTNVELHLVRLKSSV